MKKVRCPLCRQWAEWEGNPYRPFCSERCRNRDLGNWADEQYRVPVEEDELPQGGEQAPPKKGEGE